MKTLKFNKIKYETIMSAEPKLILKGMRNYFNAYYGEEKVESHRKYLFVKGDIPICLVAHIDVVIHSAYEFHYCEDEQMVFSLSGADDDRNGIYCIAEIIRLGYKPYVLLLDEEESGGLGALEFIKKHYTFPGDIKFFLELDRQGHNDMVTYDYHNPVFDKDICKYGFKKAIGTFTDISYLAPFYNRGAANLSVGYNMEHTIGCHTYINSMINTIRKVCNILSDWSKFDTYIWPKDTSRKEKKDIYLLAKSCGYTNLYGHRYPLNPAYDDYLYDSRYASKDEFYTEEAGENLQDYYKEEVAAREAFRKPLNYNSFYEI